MVSLSRQARSIERDFFGALLGLLVGTVIARVLLMMVDINLYVLGAIVLIAGWSMAMVFHFGAERSSATISSMQGVAERIRATCLRAVLWLLGAAAVLGVLSVLTGSFDVIGRVAGTAAVTACAAGLMWPFLVMLDERKHWRIGLLGVANVLTAYLLVTPSIWELGHRSIETALTALVLILMLPAGVIGLRLSLEQKTRAAGLVLTLMYLVATGIFISSAWTDHWRNSEKLVGTGFTLLGFGVLASIAMLGAFTAGDRRHWRWFGVLAAIAAAGMLTYNLWQGEKIDTDWIIVVGSVAVVAAHANLAFLAPLSGMQVIWRIGTVAAVVTTAATLDLDLLLRDGPLRGITMLGRIALASGILASTGSLAMLILARLSRRSHVTNPSSPIRAVSLVCPRCGRKQAISLGEACCDRCGLGFRIEIVANEPASIHASRLSNEGTTNLGATDNH